MPEIISKLPALTKKIAALWGGAAVTKMAWEAVDYPHREGLPDISDSQTRPFWVTAQFEGETLLAVAKPLDPKRHKGHRENLTGHESPVLDKIAFDIAHELGLPVAPAVLWEHKSGEKFVLSLAPFENTITGSALNSTLGNFKLFEDLLTGNHLAALTAISVFNLLVGQNDDHLGNILLDKDAPGRSPVIFIDYHSAFQEEGMKHGKPRAPGIVDFLGNPLEGKSWSDMTLRAMDASVIGDVAGKIAALTADRLAEIVERVPDSFFGQQPKDRLMHFLQNASEKFGERLEERFGNKLRDERWPDTVKLSERNDLPPDLKSLLPKSSHFDDVEESLPKRSAPSAPRCRPAP